MNGLLPRDSVSLSDVAVPVNGDAEQLACVLKFFMDSCFWHGHACHMFRWPKSRESYWYAKVTRNMKRDRA